MGLLSGQRVQCDGLDLFDAVSRTSRSADEEEFVVGEGQHPMEIAGVL